MSYFIVTHIDGFDIRIRASSFSATGIFVEFYDENADQTAAIPIDLIKWIMKDLDGTSK